MRKKSLKNIHDKNRLFQKPAEPLVVYKLWWRKVSRRKKDFRKEGEKDWKNRGFGLLRQQGQDRRQYRLICPCVPLYGAGGVVAGQGSLERICPDFGRRKKEGAWSRYPQRRTLTEAKKLCRWKPAIKWAGVSSNHPQCGDFLALRADIKIRRLTSIKTFFSEEINQKP